MKINIKYLFSFPFILSNLDVNVNNSDPVITQLAYGVFLLSLVALFCFINILGYIISYYLIEKSNYRLKYPRLKIIIDYFRGVSLIYFIIECILCLTCLILLIVFSILFIIK
jgi:putative copper export protein